MTKYIFFAKERKVLFHEVQPTHEGEYSVPQVQRDAAEVSDTGVNRDGLGGEDVGATSASKEVCDSLDKDRDREVDVDRNEIVFSASEHDAFCALWQAVVWDVVLGSRGRIPRPTTLVAQYFHEMKDARVFINRLSAAPFSLLKFVFLHKTDLHEGETFETASEVVWMRVAQRIRVKRESARPPSPQESFEATMAIWERRKEELQQERSEIKAEHEAVMTEFEERFAANTWLVAVEDAAIEKMRELLCQVADLTTAGSSDLD